MSLNAKHLTQMEISKSQQIDRRVHLSGSKAVDQGVAEHMLVG